MQTFTIRKGYFSFIFYFLGREGEVVGRRKLSVWCWCRWKILFQLQLKQRKNFPWSDPGEGLQTVVSVSKAETLNICINLSGLD